jgi:predicted methyltransferase
MAEVPLPLQSLHLMQVIHEKGSISPWVLTCSQDGTLKQYYETLEHLKTHKLIEMKENKLFLTADGTTLIKAKIGEAKPFNSKCGNCQAIGYAIGKDSQHVLDLWKKIVVKRPAPMDEYDQQSITEEDAVMRIGFFHEYGDLLDKELLMIGDFDCLSIVAALTGLPKRVVVFEIAEGLINFINETAKEYGLRLEAHKFDVRQPLPDAFRGKFDLFSCDPVETLEGIKLYLSRGTQGLKGIGSCGYIGLTSLEAGKKKWYDIQKVLFDMGFVVTDLRRNFNGYPDNDGTEYHTIFDKLGCKPDCIWYWSAVLRVEAVIGPNPIVTGYYDDSKGDIYMDDEAWATPVLDKKEAK